MTALTLAQFLLARIGELEAMARAPWLHVLADVQAWWDTNEDEPGFFADDQPDDVKGLAKTLLQIETTRGTYARVLAECEAKRRIVELHKTVGYEDAEMNEVGTGCHTCGFGTDPCETLCALALPYADHRDYHEAWRP